jgi:small subunit ribosomal protein S17
MDIKKGSTVLGMPTPEKSCAEKKCPFHGQLAVKNELFTGKIIKRDTNRSATLEWTKSVFVPKYERYEVRRYRLRVHNPGCLDAHIGDKVIAAKTRPLSKTKNLVIVQVVERGGEVEAESENSKTTATKKEGKIKVKK